MNKTLERITLLTAGTALGVGLTLASSSYWKKPEYSNVNQVQGVYFSQRDDCSKRLINEIEKAKSSIFMEIYTFTDKEIAQALIDAKKRGVKVKAIFDKKQSAIPSSLDEFLEQNNIEIRFEGGAGIMHNKVLIIDDYVVTTGSFNYTKSADQVNNENILIIMDNAIADKYTSEFDKLWQVSKKR